MDQCKNCTVRGDFFHCLKTECGHHENWIFQEWDRENKDLRAYIKRLEKALADTERMWREERDKNLMGME